MRILALLPRHRPLEYAERIGGGEISNWILLEGLAAGGHEVTILSFSDEHSDETMSSNVHIVRVPGSRLGRSVGWVVKRLLYRRYAQQLIVKDYPDVLVATTDAVGIGVMLGNLYRIPTAVIIRAFENLEMTSRNRLRQTLYPKRLVKRAFLGDCGPDSLRRADLLLANSQFMAGVCHERVPGIPTAVVYPPLDIRVCELREQYVPAVVSMVGTSQSKGTAMVFRIAKQLPDIEFRILGCPELVPGEIIKEGNVARIGWCNTQTEFRENADIVLVPSLWQEPFGRVAIEALAAGKIPLVADVGGLPETVSYEPDLIVPANNEFAWVSRLRNAIEDPRKYWSAAAVARGSLDKFRYDVQVSLLEEVLCKTVGRR